MDYQEKLAFLRSYRWSLARERDLLNQIEEIKARAARTTQALSGVPGTPGNSSGLARAVEALIDAQQSLCAQIEASCAARRRKRALKEAADLFLALPVSDRRRWNKLARMGLDPEEIDNQMAVVVGLQTAAADGDARAARQSDIARASQPPKKGYTNEKLGAEFVLPEHAKKFAQPPTPPQGDGKKPPSALQLDCYELDKLNWQRRQEGKPAFSYGKWVALGRPKT